MIHSGLAPLSRVPRCNRRPHARGPHVVARIVALLVGLAGMSAAPVDLYAQSTTARLSGVVADESGAVLPGVELRLVNAETAMSRVTTASTEGAFAFDVLPPGRYTLRAQRTGFAPAEFQNLVLNGGDNVALQVTLKVGTQISEAVTVVGSSIRGLDIAPSSPVRIFEKAEIEQTGAATVHQFLQTLPQHFGGGANAGNVANSGSDRDVGVNDGRGTSINLRGLGTGTTLTLINGNRVTASNQFQYVDVSLIPMTAVERIEVLTDGASAIYGADAIGGVVNIVLRKDFAGYETRARYGSVTTGGLQEVQGSLTGGWAWNRGRALVSYEFLRQNNLLTSEKAFSRNAPGTYDLFPQSERQSVYGSLSQGVAKGLVLEVNGIYAFRDVKAFRGTTTDFETNVPSTEQLDVTAGLKYDLPKRWQARLNGALGHSFVENTGFRTAASGAISPSSEFRVATDAWSVNLAGDGPLFSLPGGEVRGAIGTTYRREDFALDSTSGTTPQPRTSGSRGIASVFGEVVIPLVGEANRLPAMTRLVVTSAVRHDHYSDFGSTTNPKVGAAWEVAPGVLFRGTYGTSFRAPVFRDLVERPGFVIVARVADPASPSGSTVLMVASTGNPALGPEGATTWTGGLELQPPWLAGVAVKLNYYNLSYTDRIDRGFPGSFASLFQQDTAPYASILIRNPSLALINQFRAIGLGAGQFQVVPVGPFAVPAGQDERNTQVILDNRLRNNAATHQDGLDFDASYGVAVGESRLGLSVAGQYILSGTRQVTPEAPRANVINQSFLPVDFKLRTGPTFNRGGWSAAAFLNYVGSYRDPANTADPTVAPWTTVELNLRYDVRAAQRLLRDSSLSLSVQNAFDADPPFVVTQSNSGFDPVNANPLGRFMSLTVTRKW